MKEQHFCLRWNDFRVNFTTEFENLREEENFIDVTLACSGKLIKAHKVVLSACSQFFKYILKENPCKHPIIVMQEIDYNHLKLIIDFMYIGEVSVAEDDLPSFLQTADNLQIRGLMDASHQYKGNFNEMTKHLQSVECADININKKKSFSGRNQRSNENKPFGGTVSASADGSVDFNLSDATQSENRIYSDPSLSAVASENMKNTSTMGYSSDEDIKPDIAISLLEIDTAESHLAYPSMQNKLDGGKFSNADVKNTTNLEIRQQNTQGSSDSRHHSLDPRPCPSCGRLYSNMSNLRQHIRLIHKPESITCPLCSKLFKNKLYLKRHLISFHELPSPSITDCNKRKNHCDSDRHSRRQQQQRIVINNNNNNNNSNNNNHNHNHNINNNINSGNGNISNNNGNMPTDGMNTTDLSANNNIFSYSNFIVSSSIVRSVSDFKSPHESTPPSSSVFHGDFLPLAPLPPQPISKVSDQDHNPLNSNNSPIPSKLDDDRSRITTIDNDYFKSHNYVTINSSSPITPQQQVTTTACPDGTLSINANTNTNSNNNNNNNNNNISNNNSNNSNSSSSSSSSNNASSINNVSHDTNNTSITNDNSNSITNDNVHVL